MNEKEYREKIDNLTKQKKRLQKEIELIDTEKSILTIEYLYKSRKKFPGRYFKVNDSNWSVYYKVLKYTQDDKLLVERFQLKSTTYFKKFELEKAIIPIDLLSEKLEIEKETYDIMKEYLIEEAESAEYGRDIIE